MTQAFFEHGKSVEYPIIDMHAHMYNFGGGYMIASEPADIIRAMDRSGVILTLFCGHPALFGGRYAFEKDLDAARQYKNRLLCYYPVASPVSDVDKDIKSIEENSEYIGMKFLADYYKIPLSDSCHDPFWEYADSRSMPVLCHTWGGSPFDGVEEAEKIVKKYRGLSFIAGHSFRGDWEGAIKIAQEYDNLYLELTAVLSQFGIVERFVKAGLADRIVFGVDAPWFSYDFGIGALLSADISDNDRIKILYSNAANILNRAEIDLPIKV